MKIYPLRQKIYSFLLDGYRWYLTTPDRSLKEAYQAALKIQAIENEYFNTNRINADTTMYGSSVTDYFNAELRKLLKTVRMRLTEFQVSRWFYNESKQRVAEELGIESPALSDILEKLQFIDKITSQYKNSPVLVNQSTARSVNLSNIPPITDVPKNNQQNLKTDKNGVLPRSIWNTFNRLKVELNPAAEKDVIHNFRQSQRITNISVKFILLLIIVPLLTHQISKTFIVSPLVEKFRNTETGQIFLNEEMEEEAMEELQLIEQRIKFEGMIADAPSLSSAELSHKMQEKAHELAEDFREESSIAIKNVFADIFSVSSFIIILLLNKPSIAILKTFFDNIVYGLSDSAQAFVIILFSDMFVGFHSPHGWEVILEGLSHHWGLSSNHSFIFLFIATFPVILDTIIKYWIFRYLNQVSPSAVATYHNMNE